MTGLIAAHMYDYLERENILPDEAIGCKQKNRGTKDYFLIDITIPEGLQEKAH